MLGTKTITQPFIRTCGLLSCLIGAVIIVNVMEATLGGVLMACLAALIGQNIDSFRENTFFLLPIALIVIFLSLALPGFFTVFLISRLMGRCQPNRIVVLAASGAIVWIGFAAVTFWVQDKSPITWILISSLFGNALGQAWAATAIIRDAKKKLIDNAW